MPERDGAGKRLVRNCWLPPGIGAPHGTSITRIGYALLLQGVPSPCRKQNVEHLVLTRLCNLRSLIAFITLLSAACGDAPTAPALGAVQVLITTTGGDPDENGYVIAVDNDRREQITASGVRVLQDFSAGTHSIALEDVAANCTVSGSNPLSVTVTAGATAQIEFVINCDATGLAVTARSGGVDLPPPFHVQVGALAPQAVGPNQTVLVTRLQPGTYTVELGGVVEGCVLHGESTVTVEVTHRTVTPVTFDVNCGTLTGVVQVTISTSGIDRDPNGYTVVTTGGWQSPAPVSGVVTFQPMPAGVHVLTLSGVASNCSLPDGAERTVALTAGGVTRDTAYVRFDVSCVRTQKIAYQQNNQIVVAYADGSNPVVVGTGYSPAWSPDGSRLAYSTFECYYYSYDCHGGLEILDEVTREVTVLPNGEAGSDPSWSSDGQRIAFVHAAPGGRRSLAVIPLDGSFLLFPVPAESLVTWVSRPGWSPDGGRIVFGCVVGQKHSSDICVVNRNGTGFDRLIDAEDWNSNPAWSPDGSSIVFGTSRFGGVELAFMAPDGSGFTRLTQGSSPSWTADSRILFARFNGIHIINRDGTGLARLTTGSHYAPSWRP